MGNSRYKFRAWDKKRKVMVYGVYPKPDGYIYAQLTPTAETMWLNAEIMQFTGLTDKNGKEIYEGDVIEHWDNKYIVPNFIPLDRSYEATNIKDNENGSDDWMSMSNVDWEVIGNIYENPKLFKKTNL